MKKKLTALLLALLLVGSLTACGGSSAISAADAADETATTDEVTYIGEPEVESTADADAANGTETSDTTITFDAGAALAYFETSEGQEWMYQYLFGAEEATEEPADESADTTDGETPDSTEESSSGFDDLTTAEQAALIKEYLSLDTVDLLTTIVASEVSITDELLLSDYTDFAGKEEAELVEELENKFDAAAWVALYENGFGNGQKALFLAWYTENNTDPGPEGTEGSVASGAENAAVSSAEDDESASGVSESEIDEDEKEVSAGYDEWLSAKLKGNADDRSKVWNDLTSATLIREYLATESGQAFLGSDEVQQLLADYYAENEDAMKDLAINTGYRSKLVKNFVIVLMIVVVVLVALFAGALILLLSLERKQADKLRQELREAKNELSAVPTRPDGGMDLELKRKLTASPVRKAADPTPPPKPVVPTTPVPPTPPTPPTPLEQKDFFTQPAARVAPVVTGYYELSLEAVNAGRYHFSQQFSVQKVSDQPTTPPTPYVGYSDHTLDLNMDYYAKAGGNNPDNARVWGALMGATVQITECFNIVTQDGTSITDVSGATGRQLVSVKRAKMGADGSITARGTITLA